MKFLPELFSLKKVADSEKICTQLADKYSLKSGRIRFIKKRPKAKLHICYSKTANKWFCGKLELASDGYFVGFYLTEFCKADNPLKAYELYVKKCKGSTESKKR